MDEAQFWFQQQAGGGGHQIGQSLRFNWTSDSTRLYRTFSSDNSNANFTISFWCKRGQLGAYNSFIAAQTDASNYEHWMWYNTDVIGSSNGTAGVASDHKSTALFRDPSAWYHVVWKNVAGGATTVYINNTQVLSFTRQHKAVNKNVNHNIGVGADSGSFGANFYLAEYLLVDGSALEPSSFAETDTTTGSWRPKKYTGTYGTNGFHLDFSDPANIGKDRSGNNNDFTATGFTTSGAGTDVMSDSPTNNYATLNPIQVGFSGSAAKNVAFAEGNLQATFNSLSGLQQVAVSTIIFSTGKWYAESYINTEGGTYPGIGIGQLSTLPQGTGTGSITVDGMNNSYHYFSTGQTASDAGAATYGNSWTTGDTIGIAIDCDNNKIWWAKNGTWQASGNPATGTNAAYTIASGIEYCIAINGWNSGSQTLNFGQRSFSYTPPTGFKALNTANLPEPTIKKGSKYFDVLTWTGTGGGSGATRSLTGLGFSPDLVWGKIRSSSSPGHILMDAVRGVGTGKYLQSNTTNAEGTSGPNEALYGYLSSLDSAGFTVTNGTSTFDNWNKSGDTYVAWCWDANGAGSTNTAGTITSTVSANASAGFSIVTWTGTGADGSYGHGLGVKPAMIIHKRRNSTSDWDVWHQGLPTKSPTNDVIYLNLTDAQNGGNSNLFRLDPTSSVIYTGSAGSHNVNGATYVDYVWSEVAGYSKFGSYTGNGSSDGPFVFCGFRPAWVMIKATSSNRNWIIQDITREPYNAQNYATLAANSSSLEPQAGAATFEGNFIDYLSNGFKLRSNASNSNATETYIFAAFSELPFKYANAR